MYHNLHKEIIAFKKAKWGKEAGGFAGDIYPGNFARFFYFLCATEFLKKQKTKFQCWNKFSSPNGMGPLNGGNGHIIKDIKPIKDWIKCVYMLLYCNIWCIHMYIWCAQSYKTAAYCPKSLCIYNI